MADADKGQSWGSAGEVAGAHSEVANTGLIVGIGAGGLLVANLWGCACTGLDVDIGSAHSRCVAARCGIDSRDFGRVWMIGFAGYWGAGIEDCHSCAHS